MPHTLLALLLLLPALAAQADQAAARPPNILMIISDDQAWRDFGFMGHEIIKTPRLDKLAAESAVFPWGYVPSSLCRPSLASMITGLYPHEHKITGNDPPKGTPRARMLKHIEAVDTLPELLAKKGYKSLQTGKWWEGNCSCGGFDAGMTHGDPKRGGRHGDIGLQIGRKTFKPIRDFLDDCGESPFFLWYAPFLPHTPHNPPERLFGKYRDKVESPHVARYYAMCEWFDETCGTLLDMLDERGMRDNTIVLFVTDNGWIQREKGRRYAPRSKRSPYEGGVRTPIMLRWPGKVKPGRHEALASSIDLAPTVLAAVGLPKPARMTGQDLIAVAAGRQEPREALFGCIFDHDVVDVDQPHASLQFRWMIQGRHKLIVPSARRPKLAVELFDLAADPWERKDLAGEQAGRVVEMRAVLDRWWPGR